MEFRRGNLSEQIVQVMQDRIRAGHYALGEKLPTEHALIEEFGVSRMVIREAIANLKANGLVTTRQGVGVFVQKSLRTQPFIIETRKSGPIAEAISVLELRIALEVEASSLAAGRRLPQALASMEAAIRQMTVAIEAGEDAIAPDLAFHRAVAEGTANQHFVNLFNYLGELLVPRSRVNTSEIAHASRADYLFQVNEEHRRVYRAIAAGDSEAARGAMRLHLIGSKTRLLS